MKPPPNCKKFLEVSTIFPYGAEPKIRIESLLEDGTSSTTTLSSDGAEEFVGKLQFAIAAAKCGVQADPVEAQLAMAALQVTREDLEAHIGLLTEENTKLKADLAAARAETGSLRGELAELRKKLEDEERAHMSTIGQRDEHEETINQICAALGMSEPEMEWSSANHPGKRAIEECKRWWFDHVSLRMELGIEAHESISDAVSKLQKMALEKKHEIKTSKGA
jgi:chromosome segregation ATPase